MQTTQHYTDITEDDRYRVIDTIKQRAQQEKDSAGKHTREVHCIKGLNRTDQNRVADAHRGYGFTDEQSAWIRKNISNYNKFPDLAAAFNKQFRLCKSYSSIETHCRRFLHLTNADFDQSTIDTKHAPKQKYTTKELEWLQVNMSSYDSVAALTDAYNSTFGYNRTAGAVEACCRQHFGAVLRKNKMWCMKDTDTADNAE